MKSRFSHQHAADYMEAWNKLAKATAFLPAAEQDSFLETAKKVVHKRQATRQSTKLTDTEMAYLAAIEEMKTARKDPNLDRNKYVVEIGEEE